MGRSGPDFLAAILREEMVSAYVDVSGNCFHMKKGLYNLWD